MVLVPGRLVVSEGEPDSHPLLFLQKAPFPPLALPVTHSGWGPHF